MKITIYELLGMVKDGKIPEKITFNGYEYLYHDKEHGYCRSCYDCTYICIDSEYYLFDILNDEVEIIDEVNKEEKKIPEKLNYPHIEIESSADDEIRDYLYKVKDKLQGEDE